MAPVLHGRCDSGGSRPAITVSSPPERCVSDPFLPESCHDPDSGSLADLFSLAGGRSMDADTKPGSEKQLSRWWTIGTALVALALGLFVLDFTSYYPRTDAAEVFANFIGIAPQV